MLFVSLPFWSLRRVQLVVPVTLIQHHRQRLKDPCHEFDLGSEPDRPSELTIFDLNPFDLLDHVVQQVFGKPCEPVVALNPVFWLKENELSRSDQSHSL